MAMLLIFINCGFYVATALGAFGTASAPGNAYNSIQGFINTEFSIGTFLTFSGSDIILVIAGVMVVATALLLNSRAFSSQGVAIGVFAGVFWVSVGITEVIFLNIKDSDGNTFPGLSIFIGIYTIVAFLVFANALVQMPTGGQKAHV